jgi:hypothetical protein
MSNILEDTMLSKDLFFLPEDALTHIFSSSETCIGELQLFKALKARIDTLTNSE